jgi:hypothetical protein
MKGEASGFASHHPLYLIFHHRYVILIFYAMVKSDDPAIGFWGFPLLGDFNLHRDRIAKENIKYSVGRYQNVVTRRNR